MEEIYSALILFGVGIIAGIMNVSAGGGSSLTLPALIFLGLDSTLANGTNRVAIIVQNVSAIASFKQSKYSQFGLSLKLSLVTLPGAIIGAILATRIDDALFQKILGVVLIGVIISMLIPRKKIELDNSKDKKIPWYAYLALFGIGFYGGFIQVGVGFLLMAALYYALKFDLIHVNMHKVFIVLIYMIPAIGIFLWTGNVNWKLGLSLALGNAIGGWQAAKLSIKKGEKFIRVILIAAVFIMSLKLLNVF